MILTGIISNDRPSFLQKALPWGGWLDSENPCNNNQFLPLCRSVFLKSFDQSVLPPNFPMEDSPMRKWYSSIFLVNATLVFVIVVSSSLLAQSQGSQHAAVLVPDSTVERPQDKGIRAHTNHLIRLQANPTPNALSPSGETPQTIRPVYKLPSTGADRRKSPLSTPSITRPLKMISRFSRPDLAFPYVPQQMAVSRRSMPMARNPEQTVDGHRKQR